MPRQPVQNSDVQDFRQKLEAFGRRQSEPQIETNPRKRRSSQTWEDVQREEMQFTEQWKDEVAFYPNKRRSIIPPQDCHQLNMSEITELNLPSPVSTMTSRSPSIDSRIFLQPRMMRDPSFIEHRDGNRNAIRPIRGLDQVLPSIETDDLDMSSFSPDTSSSWSSEPRTPEGAYLEDDTSNTQSTQFINAESLIDAERNLLAAFAPRKTSNTIFNERFYAETIPGSEVNAKSQTVGADFEAAFEEFMNVS